MADRAHCLRAVEDGKNSPICRKVGFALVRSKPDGGLVRSPWRYRAARLDQPLDRGEAACAHFEFLGGEDGGGRRWIVLPPPLKTPDPALLERLKRANRSRQHDRAGSTRPKAKVAA